MGLYINSAYSFFIAIRLPAAEKITVFFIIAVDFFLQLRMIYKIVQLHNMVNDETPENGSIEKQRMVRKLALAELTEGMTPIAYAIGFSCAYYGYNSTILGNVKNDYWGYKKVDDIGYLFQMMILLFGFDSLCALANSFVLSISTDVSLLREWCRILNRYWHFISVKFAFKMGLMFTTKDINLGMYQDCRENFGLNNENKTIKYFCEVSANTSDKICRL